MEKYRGVGIEQHMHEPAPKVEIDGVCIDVVSSNIRCARKLAWSSMGIEKDGYVAEGDLVIVRVAGEVGSVSTLEDLRGVDQPIHDGSILMGVFAHRTSGTSESGHVPVGQSLSEIGLIQLLSVGGVVGELTAIPPTKLQRPTQLIPLGFPSQDGRKINLAELYGDRETELRGGAPVVFVCGTSAEVGKTTTAKSIISAFSAGDIDVAAAKVSGTGRMRDVCNLQIAGAKVAMDFPEVGLASTYTSREIYIPAIYALLNRIDEMAPEIIVAEAGGDLLEANVDSFLMDEALRSRICAMVVVPQDVTGAYGAVQIARSYGVATPMYVAHPWRQNAHATKERMQKILPNCESFDQNNPEEAARVVTRIMNS